jgi:CHAD domain-containing protein
MPFRIKRKEPVGDAIKRIVHEELQAARDEAMNPRLSIDERVHGMRCRLKKARAALRLADPDAGRLAAGEARALRKIGRSLAPAREVAAAEETLRTLSARPSDGSDRESAAASAEIARWMRPAGAADGAGRAVAGAVAQIEGVQRRAGHWKLKRGGQVVRRAVHRTYRRARHVLRDLGADGTAANFHEWRKAVKRLVYQLRILGRAAPDLQRSLGPRLERLSDLLGEVHDPAAVEATIASPPRSAKGDESVDVVLLRLRARSAAARAEALALGTRTLTKSPREVRARLDAGWQAWR